jgi:hypothetical protein
MNHDERRSDAELVEQIRTALNAQAVTPDVDQRLRAARHNAVTAATPRTIRMPTVWLPVGALAATLFAVVLLRPSLDLDATPPLDDEVQLAAAENLELLENLEFAAWMVESEGPDAG